MQVSQQLLCFHGKWAVQPLLDAPFTTELFDDQVGISTYRYSPWRTGSKVLQDVQNTGIFRHIVGHAPALANIAVFPQQDRTVLGFDHDSERGGPSGINRFASPVEPGEVFIAGTMYDGASQSEYLGVEYLSVRECLINGSGRVAVA